MRSMAKTFETTAWQKTIVLKRFIYGIPLLIF